MVKKMTTKEIADKASQLIDEYNDRFGHLKNNHGYRKVTYSCHESICEGRFELFENKNLQTGLFHKWVKLEDVHRDTRENNIYALIEMESGYVTTVYCECLKFID